MNSLYFLLTTNYNILPILFFFLKLFRGQVKLPTNQRGGGGGGIENARKSSLKTDFREKYRPVSFRFFYIYLQKAPGTLNTTQNTNYH